MVHAFDEEKDQQKMLKINQLYPTLLYMQICQWYGLHSSFIWFLSKVNSWGIRNKIFFIFFLLEIMVPEVQKELKKNKSKGVPFVEMTYYSLLNC